MSDDPMGPAVGICLAVVFGFLFYAAVLLIVLKVII